MIIFHQTWQERNREAAGDLGDGLVDESEQLELLVVDEL